MQAVQVNTETSSAFDEFFKQRATQQFKTVHARTTPVTHKFNDQEVKFGGAVKRTIETRKNSIAEAEFNRELPDNHSIIQDALKTQYADISDVEIIVDEKRKPYDRQNALTNVRNSVVTKVTSQANELLHNVGVALKRNSFDSNSVSDLLGNDLLRFQVNITEFSFGSERQKVFFEAYSCHDPINVPVLEYKQELKAQGKPKQAEMLVSVYATLIGHLASLGTGFHAEHTAEMLYYEPFEFIGMKNKDDKLAIIDFFDRQDINDDAATITLKLLLKHGALEGFQEFLMIRGYNYDDSEGLSEDEFIASIEDNGFEESLTSVVREYLEPSIIFERYGILGKAMMKMNEQGNHAYDVEKAHRILKRNKRYFQDFDLLNKVFSAAKEIKQPKQATLEYLNEGAFGASAIIMPMRWGHFQGTPLASSVDQFVEGEAHVGEGSDMIGFSLDSEWHEPMQTHLMANALLAALHADD
jgi:hypothetical protein